jgi:hypothetical protein
MDHLLERFKNLILLFVPRVLSAQFQEKNNLYYAATGVPALWFSLDQVKRISDNARTKAIPKLIQLSGDMAPLLGLPLILFATFLMV